MIARRKSSLLAYLKMLPGVWDCEQLVYLKKRWLRSRPLLQVYSYEEQWSRSKYGIRATTTFNRTAIIQFFMN